MHLKYLLALLLFSPGLLQAESELTPAEIEDLLGVKIRFATHMAFNPSIIRAVEEQNSRAITLAEIKNALVIAFPRDFALHGGSLGLNLVVEVNTGNFVNQIIHFFL